MENVINDLVFSDDGLRLAAVLGGDRGLRVFDLMTMARMATWLPIVKINLITTKAQLIMVRTAHPTLTFP